MAGRPLRGARTGGAGAGGQRRDGGRYAPSARGRTERSRAESAGIGGGRDADPGERLRPRLPRMR